MVGVSAACKTVTSPTPHRVLAAQHILLKGGDADTRAAAAEAIKAQIEAGETTFEKAAREFSECPSRAEVNFSPAHDATSLPCLSPPRNLLTGRGIALQTPAGSLGQFGPGKMVQEFDDYVFDKTCAPRAPRMHSQRTGYTPHRPVVTPSPPLVVRGGTGRRLAPSVSSRRSSAHTL